MVGRWCACAPTSQVPCASWVYHPPTRIHVRLLGPCFKTGRLEPFRQRPERAGAEARDARLQPQPTRRHTICTAGPAHVDQGPALGATPRRARPKPGPTRCLQSLSPQQFQALFDSLFKVLFIFPSRYLFAIGLSPVFSLRWNLPPTLGCNPKQPDSSNAARDAAGSTRTGLSPSPAPRSRGLGRGRPQRSRL
jgi:hypothetical protein